MKKQTTVDIYKIYFEMGIEDIWQLFEIEASCSVLHVFERHFTFNLINT